MVYRVDHFVENSINPITNRQYDASWIVLVVTDSAQYHQSVGRTNGCAYTMKVSREKCCHWKTAVGDFIDFHESLGKNMILVMSEADYTAVRNDYEGHHHRDAFLRDYEPNVLVHSTSMNNWDKIRKDGMLKCWSKLKAENAISEETPIGMKLGDPPDMSDYIMFGSGVAAEIVVYSKQKGIITMDTESEYFTGARLYFDAEKMARDRILIRDGCHLKVRDKLSLTPYLIWVATWDVIGLEGPVSTPRIFAEQSDGAFQQRFPQFA